MELSGHGNNKNHNLYCPKCGAEILDWARVCNDCRARDSIDRPPERQRPVPATPPRIYCHCPLFPTPTLETQSKAYLESEGIENSVADERIVLRSGFTLQR